MEYLYSQSGSSLATKTEDEISKEIDEGFGDIEDLSPNPTLEPMDGPELETLAVPFSEDSDVEVFFISLLITRWLLCTFTHATYRRRTTQS